MIFLEFWTHNLSVGYPSISDPFLVSPSAFHELRANFIITFTFFFCLFWLTYLLLSYIIQPTFFTERKTTAKKYEVVILINGNLHHVL